MLLKDWLSRITDRYTKDENSNIGKLLKIFVDEMNQLEAVLEKAELWRDVDEAQGTTLDGIGSIIGAQRGVNTDEKYRLVIKARAAQNRSEGTINSIVSMLTTMLNVEPSKIKIEENPSGTPAAIKLNDIPVAEINAAGMTIQQFAALVRDMTASGVSVEAIVVVGTFDLTSTLQTGQATGFGDIAGTTGGTLGATL